MSRLFIGQHFVTTRVVHLPKRTQTSLITKSDRSAPNHLIVPGCAGRAQLQKLIIKSSFWLSNEKSCPSGLSLVLICLCAVLFVFISYFVLRAKVGYWLYRFLIIAFSSMFLLPMLGRLDNFIKLCCFFFFFCLSLFLILLLLLLLA